MDIDPVMPPRQFGAPQMGIALVLDWVLENHSALDISVVCMSLGAGNNQQDDSDLSDDDITERIEALREALC